MFIVMGWDDNDQVDGMKWSMGLASSRKNPDGSPMHFSYYNTTVYAGTTGASWKQAMDAGHEMGNHTQTHNTAGPGSALTKAAWETEVSSNESGHAGVGIAKEFLYGFRAPRLEYNDNLFQVLDEHDYYYDCSIEEGWQWDADGTNYNWPYTLDELSPGNQVMCKEWDPPSSPCVEMHPGLWEMPAYPFVIPTELREMYKPEWVTDEWDGKHTGFDYNIWVKESGGLNMTGAHALATFKNTLDLRLEGNRAPFLMGLHTGEYSDSNTTFPADTTAAQRRATMEAFVDYALTKNDVRFVSAKDVIDWMRNPKPLP